MREKNGDQKGLISMSPEMPERVWGKPENPRLLSVSILPVVPPTPWMLLMHVKKVPSQPKGGLYPQKVVVLDF